MAGWSRSKKPTTDTTLNPDNIIGIDESEVGSELYFKTPGWYYVRTAGGRTTAELLVAMSDGPDIEFVFDEEPSNTSVEEGNTATFNIDFDGVYSGAVIAWQVSTNSGSSWSLIAEEDGFDLNLAAVTTGMSGRWYRARVTWNGEDHFSEHGVLTVTPA